ncbi:MAG: alpha/beta hydrolase [Paludibacteraceae bacterium]|nr:alpha/beta hydrolase [Paludibacteraceae bacterium]
MMRQNILAIVSLLMQFMPLQACTRNEQKIDLAGPQGKIACTLTLPKDFDPATDQVPMVILMHGIFASKDLIPIPSFAKGLAEVGIASIRLDFNGHGKSEGRMQDMTIEKELTDARAVWDYVQSLPYVSRVGLLGHSQGGVIASMTAGRLAAEQQEPAGVVLVAPGSVIKEACQGGKFFNARFDPQNPPEYIRCWGVMKLGREYLLTTQQLDIFGTAAAYQGPVLLLHGDKDKIVPLWCSEKYLETYGDRAALRVIPGVNHTITTRRKKVVRYAVDFFRQVFDK